MCSSEDDDWTSLAMSNDSLVALQLLRLSHADLPPPPPLQLPLEATWSVKQRRSNPRKKAVGSSSAAAADMAATSSARGSPTTPLSWRSGGTSASPGIEAGFEESSLLVDAALMNPVVSVDITARSKAAAVANGTTTVKRSRKKKTLPELKEEESVLLKERRLLENQLAVLRHSLEKQRAENESLKRIKGDSNLSHKMQETASASVNFGTCNPPQPHQVNGARYYPSHSLVPTVGMHNKLKEPSPTPIDSFQTGEACIGEHFSGIPDLNMVPGDDDSGPEVLCGLS